MAASPLSPPFPAVFRFLTPTRWSHAKVPNIFPIELLTARPPIASGYAGGEACNVHLNTCGHFMASERATLQAKGAMFSRPGS